MYCYIFFFLFYIPFPFLIYMMLFFSLSFFPTLVYVTFYIGPCFSFVFLASPHPPPIIQHHTNIMIILATCLGLYKVSSLVSSPPRQASLTFSVSSHLLFPQTSTNVFPSFPSYVSSYVLHPQVPYHSRLSFAMSYCRIFLNPLRFLLVHVCVYFCLFMFL